MLSEVNDVDLAKQIAGNVALSLDEVDHSLVGRLRWQCSCKL